jgi:threonine synthase
MGLPIKRLIAATNENDTVPRFMESGHWDPHATVATMTNAMDVARPNNFPRVLKLAQDHAQEFNGAIYARRVSELATRSGIEQLYGHGYLADPHSALAWSALVADMSDREQGIFLCTAHPAKFKETLEQTLAIQVQLPMELAAVASKDVLSTILPADYAVFQAWLQGLASDRGIGRDTD